jgi:tetratricopeptide (TPR) repeat protein
MKTLAAALLYSLAIAITAAETAAPSPAQKAIAGARDRIRKDPALAAPYNDLAKALIRRARETGDPDYYRQAEEALADSFRVEPDNFEGHKTRVLILLGRREYAPALELARKLNKHIPDDVLLYGMIGDACLALGNYAEAEAKINLMFALRRANLPAMIHGAPLRVAFGSMEGAEDWLTSAYQITSFTETEERAWLLTHIGRVRLQMGKPDSAAQVLAQALETFPDSYYALDALADVRSAQGKYPDAVELLQRSQKIAPHPRRLFSLGVALKQAGDPEAKRVFAEFERQAAGISGKPDNANRELILYYVDHAGKPAEALKIAQAEVGRRKDIPTLDAYAWALYANGRYAEARAELEKALKIGVRDASLFEHAAAIAGKLEDETGAASYRRKARELRP